MGVKTYCRLFAGAALLCATAVTAEDAVMEDNVTLQRCLLERLTQSAANTPVSELLEYCKTVVVGEASVVGERLFDERLIENNPFVY